MSPYNAWFFAAGLAAVAELDNAAACQFMICRPIVLGPLLGAALGQIVLGAGLGVVCELFCLEELPVGGCLPLNATMAAATAVLLAAGPIPAAPEAALPAGLLAGWTHAKLESFLRRRRGGLNAVVETRLKAGQEPRLGSLALGELATQAAANLTLLLVFMCGAKLLSSGWRASPNALRAGLHFGLGVSPVLGLWSLIRSFKVVS